MLELFGDDRHWKTIANVVIIQLVHSFEVNIRICQPENSYVHRGKAEVNITFECWLIQMFTKKNAPIVLLYDTVSLFLVLFKVFLYFINLLKSDVPSALLLGRLFQQSTSQISGTLMR